MRKYGWINQLPDQRDLRSYMRPVEVPKSVDLRGKMPPIYDQGSLGSCTANGIAAAIQYDNDKQGEEAFMPSRLFIYYNERVIIDSVNYDSGACIRDGIKSVNAVGVCREATWPYVIGDFKKKPSEKAYLEASECKSVVYHAVDQLASQLEMHLAAGFSIVFGFTVYESFEFAEVTRTGKIPLPQKDERVMGGHCVKLVGYKDKRYVDKLFRVRNSYGKDWGEGGYGEIPYDYILNPALSSDFWVIEQVT